MTSSDVCVVGGGPAGAVFATLARRTGDSVLLLSGERPMKPHLETLSPPAVRMLSDVGLRWCLGASGAIRSSGMTDAWSAPARRVRRTSVADPWGSAWHVDRARFDTALREAARREGVRVVEARVEAVWATGDGFQVSSPGFSTSCHRLVDATGATARVARLLRIERTVVDRQLALSAQLSRSVLEPALIVASVEDGWLYVTPRGEASAQVAVVTDRDVLRLHGTRELLRRALLGGELEATPDDLGPIRTSAIVSQFVSGEQPRRFATIGDAAWTPDPLSGHGVARALESATRLAWTPTACPPRAATCAIEHLRARSRLYAASPWKTAPYYQNRLRACIQAEEALHGHTIQVD